MKRQLCEGGAGLFLFAAGCQNMGRPGGQCQDQTMHRREK